MNPYNAMDAELLEKMLEKQEGWKECRGSEGSKIKVLDKKEVKVMDSDIGQDRS
jgi:hypothetical protein